MVKELNHIGYIVDGNRRWAKERGLPTVEGHKRGFNRVIDTIDALKNTGIKYLSFYIFSTENWQRSSEEVNYLMKLVESRLDSLIQKCQKENIRCLLLGRREPVKESLWNKLQRAEQNTAKNTGMTVCLCFNYGGQWEIVDAAVKILKKYQELPETADFSQITPEDFKRYLYQPTVPPLDLIVRTSGEERISGFLLWRAAYAEMMFLEKKFPDLEKKDHQAIIDEFNKRSRRFGK